RVLFRSAGRNGRQGRCAVSRRMKLRRRRVGKLGAALGRGFRQGTAGGPATAAGAFGGAPAAAGLAPGAFATARLAGDGSAAGPLSGLAAAARASSRSEPGARADGPGAPPAGDSPSAQTHNGSPHAARAPAAPGDRNRRRTLASLALGLIAVATTIGSGADFSAKTANPSN